MMERVLEGLIRAVDHHRFGVARETGSAWHPPQAESHACELRIYLFGKPFACFSVRPRQPWLSACGGCHGDSF